MTIKIKNYFEKLEPNQLGIDKKIKVSYIKKLGQGTSNLNYLVKLVGVKNKFIFRMNMNLTDKKKSRREFNGLKAIENLGISPVAIILDDSRKDFDTDFLIIEYIDGKTLNNSSIYMKDKMIIGVSRMLGKIHSIKIKGAIKEIEVEADSPEEVSGTHGTSMDYIRRNIKNKRFIRMIEESMEKAEKINKKRNQNIEKVLTQGDICEQNVIYHKGEFRLIDFENIELADPTLEITRTLIDFGKPFNESQKKLFYDTYLGIRNDPGLKIRVEQYIPITYLRIFIWSLQHTLKTKNKEFHESFNESNDVLNDLSYVKTMFKRNIAAGVIDKKYSDFDMGKILGL